MFKWKELSTNFERHLRLRTFPLAFKLFEDVEEMKKIEGIERPKSKGTGCQFITSARTYGLIIGAIPEDYSSPNCPGIIGLIETPKFFCDGTMRGMLWAKDKKEGKKADAALPRIPPGRYNGVAMAPLAYEKFTPDIVLIYGTPAQMILLINGIQFEDYERLTFYSVGESACADSIVQCYLSGKPSLTIPCYGERWLGHVQEEELVMALPADKVEKTWTGLEGLASRGISYPIPYIGATADPAPLLPERYSEMEKEVKKSK